MSTQQQKHTPDPEKIFTILQPLGEGTFGKVHKALDNRDGEMVSLEIMPVGRSIHGIRDMELFKQQTTLFKSCNSPYIVNVRDVFIKETKVWIAMDYCGAGSALDLMKKSGNTLCVSVVSNVLMYMLLSLSLFVFIFQSLLYCVHAQP